MDFLGSIEPGLDLRVAVAQAVEAITGPTDEQCRLLRLLAEAADRERSEVGVVVTGHPALTLSGGGDDAAHTRDGGHGDTRGGDDNGA